jgi:SAM-dependent methyltransferase
MLQVHSEASHHAKGYLLKARLFFEKNSKGMELENHYHHNVEPNFWKHMVNPVLENPIASSNQLALEFGCGAGRNLLNLLIAAPFLRVDGIDISKGNASSAQVFVEKKWDPVGPYVSKETAGRAYLSLPILTLMLYPTKYLFTYLIEL